MPYIKLNDKNQIVGLSDLPQEEFEFVEKIPTDIINVMEEYKSLNDCISELKNGDYKIIRFSEKKESGKKTKLTQSEFDSLSDERDILRTKIDDIKKLLGV